MWIYSTTAATSAQGETTSSACTSVTAGLSATDFTYRNTTLETQSGETYVAPSRTIIVGTTSAAFTDVIEGVDTFTANTASARTAETNDVYGTTTAYTTANTDGTTTLSGSTSTTRTRDSYRSTTQTTTSAINQETTTTSTATASTMTTAAGPTTTSTATTDTFTASTTTPATVTSTTYGVAASTTLAAAESLVPITELAASEQGWDVTATVESAGYASQLGTTFSKRTGTLATTSTVLPLGAYSTFTTTYLVTATSGSTLKTTLTSSSSDTFAPCGDWWPPSTTSTRSFTLLTTDTTITGGLYSTVTVTQECAASIFAAPASTLNAVRSTTANITYNLDPTETSTGTVHFTWASSTALALFRFPPPHATSSTAIFPGGSATGTASINVTTTRSTDTTTTQTASTDTTSENTNFSETLQDSTTSGTSSSENDTFSTSYTDNLSTSPFDSSFDSNVESWTSYFSVSGFSSTSGITQIHGASATVSSTTQEQGETTSTSSSFSGEVRYQVVPPFSFFISSSQTTESFSTNYFTTAFGTLSFTTTSDADTLTTSTSTTETATTTRTTNTTTSASTTTASGQATSQTEIEGISWTFPLIQPQVTYDASQRMTALAHRPAEGYRAPLGLASTADLFSNLGLAGTSTLYYPWRATQDDSNGAHTPILYTDEMTFATGSTVETARWDTSDSRLHFTTGISSTFTIMVSTSTVTQTVTTSTAAGTASFSGSGAATYFSEASSSSASAGSRIGGVPVISEFAVHAIMPPGVAHTTSQTAGTSSSSATTWQTGFSSPTETALAAAIPMRTETVASVTQQATAWEMITLAGAPVLWATNGTGATARPIITLSKYPAL